MNRRLVARWALLIALALVVAACAEDDDVAEEPDDDSGDAEEEVDDELDDAADAPDDWPEELVFTLTPSQEVQQLIDDAEPLAEMLEERLGIDVEASVPTDYAGVIVALASGEADVAGGLGPVQMVQSEEQAGAELILQSERFGDLIYVTQWFTTDPDTFCADEPVEETYEEDGDAFTMRFCNGVNEAAGPGDGPIGGDMLPEAEGRSIAFVDEGSASGFFVPALQLIELGIDPFDDVEQMFAGGHDNAVITVYEGDADIGLSYNDAREDVVDQFADIGEEVVVFGWSDPIPNDGFAVRGDLPEDLTEAITEAFLDIASTDEGVELLQDLYNIDDLVTVDSADFDVMRDVVAELEEYIEE